MKRWQIWSIVTGGVVIVVVAAALLIQKIPGMTGGEKIILAVIVGMPIGAMGAAVGLSWEDRG
jgi:hypothetical protein